MALVFGKAAVNRFLGLFIQAIEILGLELLEILGDGVCEEERHRGLGRPLAPRIPLHRTQRRQPVGVAVCLLPISASRCFANH